MRIRHLVSLALATVLFAAIPALARADSTVLGGFSARPLDPSGDPALRSYFNWHVQAGRSYRGELLVSNSEKTTVHLRVYAVDGVTGTTSGAVYPTGGAPIRRDGRWLRPAVSSLTLAPRSTRTIVFRVHVPAAARPGDHIAAIALENADHPRAAHGSIAIIEVIRSAVAVELHVAGPATRAVALSTLGLRSLPGTQIASAVVGISNTGDLMCKPRLTVTVSGNGVPPTTTTRELDYILPGDRIPYPLAWPHALGAGAYTLTAVASGCGPETTLRRSVNLGVSLRSSASPQTPVASPSAAHSSTPWLLIVLVGGGGLLLGLLLSRRRPQASS